MVVSVVVAAGSVVDPTSDPRSDVVVVVVDVVVVVVVVVAGARVQLQRGTTCEEQPDSISLELK